MPAERTNSFLPAYFITTQRLHCLYTKMGRWQCLPVEQTYLFKEAFLPVPLQSCFLPHPAMQEKSQCLFFFSTLSTVTMYFFNGLCPALLGNRKPMACGSLSR